MYKGLMDKDKVLGVGLKVRGGRWAGQGRAMEGKWGQLKLNSNKKILKMKMLCNSSMCFVFLFLHVINNSLRYRTLGMYHTVYLFTGSWIFGLFLVRGHGK